MLDKARGTYREAKVVAAQDLVLRVDAKKIAEESEKENQVEESVQEKHLTRLQVVADAVKVCCTRLYRYVAVGRFEKELPVKVVLRLLVFVEERSELRAIIEFE